MKTETRMIRYYFMTMALVATMLVSGCDGSTRNEQVATRAESNPNDTEMVGSEGIVSGEKILEPASGEQAAPAKVLSKPSDKVIQMTTADFKKLIFNYEKNPDEWVFEGDRPCIVDFYADWCRPCKLVAPIMDELAAKYAGQITIYKVNTDQERELSQVFGIRSIPSMLFCPTEGKPQMTAGALPKETYEEVIQNFLLNQGPASTN